MREKISIILTVPHAVLSSVQRIYGQHPFDYVAKERALQLKDRLLREGFSDVELLLSDYPRSSCDLNRFACSHLPFRQRLRELLDKKISESKQVILLDVHSFPVTLTSDWDFYVIDNHYVRSFGESQFASDFGISLIERMKRRGLHVAIFFGGENAIIIEAMSRYPREKLRSLLLEFSEEATAETTDRVLTEVVEWLKDVT